jgi:hypothetical protein
MNETDPEPQASRASAAEIRPETFEEREARARELIGRKVERFVAVRNKDREFHGLEREFIYAQAELLQLYEKSKDIKHPRDVGNTREAILGRFLATSGYLPKKYSVSNTSVRVASAEGFVSREIDILLFDAETSIVLMQREDAYQVYPAESAYGAIEVKSKLSRQELRKAFDNIASFKRLRKVGTRDEQSERGFGIIFAYDSDLEWMQLFEAVKELALESSRSVLPNLVVVLNKGYFLFGEDGTGKLRNFEIEAIQDLKVQGRPDREARCLYDVYLVLMMLLRDGEAPPVPIERYWNLPLTAGKYSYEFAYGLVSELGSCKDHGDYPRQIGEEAFEKVLAFCQSEQPTEYLKALSEAVGERWNGPVGQNSRSVWIYNPERLPPSELLLTPEGVLMFDEIVTSGTHILIPISYSVKEGIISGCRACAQQTASSKLEDQTES